MSTFEDREHAFEAKFAHDEEMQFKARARRNRFLAVWASGVKGGTAEEAREYARQLIHEDLQHPGDEEVVEALVKYLDGACSEEDIRAKMVEMMGEAKDQILHEED